MIAMTVVNIHMKEQEKKKLLKFIEAHDIKSYSEFIRQVLSEKIRIEEFAEEGELDTDPEVPEYIPKNKYVAFVNGAIASIGESPSEVAHNAMLKFPHFPIIIKYSGESDVKPLEYCFMSLSEFHGWKYSKFQTLTYPLLPISFKYESGENPLLACIDTAASLCLLKEGIIPLEQLSLSRKENIFTAGGLIQAEIYSGIVRILDVDFEIEFIISPINNQLPFEFLIGRNLFDQLDAYFLGKKRIFFLKKAD